MSYKMVIIVRKDIDIDKGKTAGQVAHAACSLILTCKNSNIQKWFDECQKKIVLKVNSLDELKFYQQKASRSGLATVMIADAGLTQIPAGTVTCLGIGPDTDERIDEVTKGLKLL